nr:ScyD/ScyE family protein [Kineococcus siccus]
MAQGLDDPFGLSYAHGKFYAAENGSGEVSGFVPGGSGPVVRASGFSGPAGVDRTPSRLLTVTGEGEGPGGSTLFVSSPGSPPRPLADLGAYELAENPDGQRQFGDDGAPLDALSNPFAVLGGRGGHERFAYVADAGANAVLAVDRDGAVSTFFAPPVVTSGACAGVPNNDPEHTGCDSVPTGLAFGPDGTLLVSALTGEVAGEGRVYVLDARTGALRRTITGLDGPTGVAAGDDGAVYVSELLEGAPAGAPEPGFDVSTVGRIVRVAPDGARSVAQVTMPLGLRWADGALHSTAWSVAGGFLQQRGLGQVVRVDARAFVAQD